MTHANIDVLLVDDSDPESKILSKAVRQALPDASLVRVKDGDQAIRFVLHRGLFTEQPQHPRLILLELNLPGTSALTVLARLRDDSKAQTIPVILLTANHCEGAMAESYALGARGHVVKPNDPTDYVHAVARVVSPYLLSTAP